MVKMMPLSTFKEKLPAASEVVPCGSFDGDTGAGQRRVGFSSNHLPGNS
jgi:hypothetical protein